MNGCANRFAASAVARVMGSALPRNMLLRLAETGLFRRRGSAFPAALVPGREFFEGRLGPPGPDGNNVLAAATSTSASVIVTDTVAAAPAEALARQAVDTAPADDFLADTNDLDPSEAVPALRRMRKRDQNRVLDVAALMHKSESRGLLQVVMLMNRHKAFPWNGPDADWTEI